MKIVRSTRRHKLNAEFPYFAEFNFQYLTTDGLEFARLCKAFERRYGPSVTQSPDNAVWWSNVYNPNWRKEFNPKQQRKRIYFKDMKDWTWAQLSK